MTIEEIKELLQLFNASGVAELELQRGDNRLRLRRSGISQEVVIASPVAAAAVPVAVPPVSSTPPAVPASAASAPAIPAAKSADVDASNILVRSPIVGTFYEASAPNSPPFVKVGDSVEPGQVLCIIESMKLMNEIEAEVAGVIASKLVENGRPVEYGEALFSIRPR